LTAALARAGRSPIDRHDPIVQLKVVRGQYRFQWGPQVARRSFDLVRWLVDRWALDGALEHADLMAQGEDL
jgi:hypothetical protein